MPQIKYATLNRLRDNGRLNLESDLWGPLGGERSGRGVLSHKYMQYAAVSLKYRNGKRTHMGSRKHILLYLSQFAFLS